MTAPLHRRTEKIGACVADPFANGEGVEEIDTFTIPVGRRRRVYRPSRKVDACKHALSTRMLLKGRSGCAADEPRRQRDKRTETDVHGSGCEALSFVRRFRRAEHPFAA